MDILFRNVEIIVDLFKLSKLYGLEDNWFLFFKKRILFL